MRRIILAVGLLVLLAGCTGVDDPLWPALAGEPLPGWPPPQDEETDAAMRGVPQVPLGRTGLGGTGGALGALTPIERTDVAPAPAAPARAAPVVEPVRPAALPAAAPEDAPEEPPRHLRRSWPILGADD